MKDLLISNDNYGYVAYLAATAISYQEVYGNIFPNGDIAQFFKQPYADIITEYVNEEADLFEVNDALINALVINEGGSFPKKMIHDDILLSRIGCIYGGIDFCEARPKQGHTKDEKNIKGPCLP